MKRLEEKSLIQWFKDKFKKKPNRKKGNNIRDGQFYSFEYDSKLYENDLIPYYDQSPLILCLGKSETHVLGLNFHYIPIKRRTRVINKLKKLYKKQWDKDKRLPGVTWNKISPEIRYATFMVKLYIRARMRKTIGLENTEMEKAITVPEFKFLRNISNKIVE